MSQAFCRLGYPASGQRPAIRRIHPAKLPALAHTDDWNRLVRHHGNGSTKRPL